MILQLSFIAVLPGMAAAQVPTAPCCNCEKPPRSDDVVCLSAKEMLDHVDHIEVLKPSHLDKGLNLCGTVAVEIRFETSGKVAGTSRSNTASKTKEKEQNCGDLLWV
jgi:hypothetical protein